jgi:hypothetical protein
LFFEAYEEGPQKLRLMCRDVKVWMDVHAYVFIYAICLDDRHQANLGILTTG